MAAHVSRRWGNPARPGQEQRTGEGESQAGTPQGRKFPVTEPNTHRIATGEHSVGHECGDRHPLAIGGGHKRDATPRPPHLADLALVRLSQLDPPSTSTPLTADIRTLTKLPTCTLAVTALIARPSLRCEVQRGRGSTTSNRKAVPGSGSSRESEGP
jgi:hypothetical protein